jgi:hypothetical protein
MGAMNRSVPIPALLFFAACAAHAPAPAPAPAPAVTQEAPAEPAEPARHAKLRISALDPDQGAVTGGTEVTFAGVFEQDGSRHLTVYFGAQEAPVIAFSQDRELTVRVPPATSPGPVDITLIFDPGGEMTIAGGFTYVAAR